MEARKLVGWNIRRLRVDRGLTIEALADEADVSPAYLGQLERGQVNAGIVLLDRLRRALAVELADLVVEPELGSRPPRPLGAGRRSLKESLEQRLVRLEAQRPDRALWKPEGRKVGARQRVEHLVRKLVMADLKRHGLNPHTAAVAAQAAVEKRLTSFFEGFISDIQAQGYHDTDRETLKELRDMPWVSSRTFRAIGRLLMDPELEAVIERSKRPAAERSKLEKVK